MLSTPLLLAVALALPGQDPSGSISGPISSAQDAKTKGETKGEAKDKEGPSLAELEKAVRRGATKVAQGKLELRIADLKAHEDQERAELAALDFSHKAEAAARELALHEQFEAPAAIEAATLSLDRAKDRLISQQQDLEGILRIYAEEEEARAKSEIIRRHQVSVQFAERGVEAAAKALDSAKQTQALANQKKERALEKAKSEARLADNARKRVSLSAELSRLKAHDSLAAAQEDLDEAKAKLAKSTGEQGVR